MIAMVGAEIQIDERRESFLWRGLRYRSDKPPPRLRQSSGTGFGYQRIFTREVRVKAAVGQANLAHQISYAHTTKSHRAKPARRRCHDPRMCLLFRLT
jgi:hypothetical protein